MRGVEKYRYFNILKKKEVPRPPGCNLRTPVLSKRVAVFTTEARWPNNAGAAAAVMRNHDPSSAISDPPIRRAGLYRPAQSDSCS